jgi:iron complex transport system permease protein
MARRLVLNIRLPRVLVAIMTGMSLAAAGTVFQMLFGNPLVEPGFLGVSQGAAFGAALGIVCFGASAWVTQGAAALFALLGLGLSVLLARRASFGGWVLRFVLAGIAVSAFFSAGVGVLKYVADPLAQLADLTFWLLGGLSAVTWARVVTIAPVVTVSLAVTVALRRRLNLLSLDDVTSFSLGAAPARERALLLAAATAATASVVSVGGIVGWVGLVVPHLARRVFGADAARSLPGAALMGGIAVLAGDDVARTVLAGEIPLGILTSLLGASAFVVLLVSRGLQVQR